MEDWSQHLVNELSKVAQQLDEQLIRPTEQWLEEIADRFLEISDQWVGNTENRESPPHDAQYSELESFLDRLNQTVEPMERSLNQQVDEVVAQFDQVLAPLVSGLSSLDQWLENVSTPLNNTVEPILQNYPACVGCRNFYGQAHGGNTLVCAMHPFGPEDRQQCLDWESVYH
ncbi:MAG: hypothetical protein ACKO21_03380 [Nodosilinea sp.]|jgi:uncharacterized coiled-coil protein SlyX